MIKAYQLPNGNYILNQSVTNGASTQFEVSESGMTKNTNYSDAEIAEFEEIIINDISIILSLYNAIGSTEPSKDLIRLVMGLAQSA